MKLLGVAPFKACGRFCLYLCTNNRAVDVNSIPSNNHFLLTYSACTSCSTSAGSSATSKSGDGLDCFVHAVSPVKKLILLIRNTSIAHFI